VERKSTINLTVMTMHGASALGDLEENITVLVEGRYGRLKFAGASGRTA
jgi:hypothetical protein